MKIKMHMNIAGMFHNIEGGVKVGDVVEVDDAEGQRYCNLGYAEEVRSHHKAEPVEEPVVEPPEERAVAPKGEQAVKRGPGRPPKNV